MMPTGQAKTMWQCKWHHLVAKMHTMPLAMFLVKIGAGVKMTNTRYAVWVVCGQFLLFISFLVRGWMGWWCQVPSLEPEGCRLILRLFHSELQKCCQLMIKCTRTENAGLLSWQFAAFCLAAKILFTTNLLQKPNQAG